MKEETNTAAVSTEPRRVPAGEAYTKDGPVKTYLLIKDDSGKSKEEREEPVTEDFTCFPKKWRERHQYAFCLLASKILMIKADESRQIPMLFEEVEESVGKQNLKDLEQMGLIGMKTVQFHNKGKRMGGRKIVWLTPVGRGLENELIRRESFPPTAEAVTSTP